jgi:hypothetical protein
VRVASRNMVVGGVLVVTMISGASANNLDKKGRQLCSEHEPRGS